MQFDNQRGDDANPTYTPYPKYTPYPTYTPQPGTADASSPEFRDSSAPTPLAVLPGITPTPQPTRTPTPTPVPAAEATATAQRLATEDLKRCDFWALNNLRPIVYAHFTELDPYNMDDFDRALWRTQLNVSSSGSYDRGLQNIGVYQEGQPSEWCQDYWSEALSSSNAYKRNEAWKNQCYLSLAQIIEETNEYFGEAIYYESAPRNAINQYVRIMNWMDIGVEELLRLEETPQELIWRLAIDESDEYEYADTSGYPYMDDELDKDDIEWFGVVYAWNRAIDGRCNVYYPQLFYNRWIPLDPEGYGVLDATPSPLPEIVMQGPNRDLFVPEKYIRE